MKHLRPILMAALLCALHNPAQAASTPATAPTEATEVQQTPEQFLATLKQQHGTITLPSGIATLTLNDEFYYLDPQDTERLLTEAGAIRPATRPWA